MRGSRFTLDRLERTTQQSVKNSVFFILPSLILYFLIILVIWWPVVATGQPWWVEAQAEGLKSAQHRNPGEKAADVEDHCMREEPSGA